MEKAASIYLSQDGVIRIGTRATTSEGLPIAHGPVYYLKSTDRPRVIGEKTLQALNDFQDRTVPHPKSQTEWKAYYLNWERNYQIKSERSFLKKGAKWLLIKGDDNEFFILPTRNNIALSIKSDVNFAFLEHKNRTTSADPEELGRAILAAFNDCE